MKPRDSEQFTNQNYGPDELHVKEVDPRVQESIDHTSSVIDDIKRKVTMIEDSMSKSSIV